MVFENAAGKTLLKYDCSNQGITSVKKIPIWKEAEYLDLSINKIWNTADVGYMLRSMPDLKRIDLDKNYIEALPPALFEYNTKLQFVNFLNNRLNGIPENLFKNNPLLEVVWFSGNKISAIPEKLFFYSSNLLFVELGRNNIRELPRTLFYKNQFLDEVHLQSNPLKVVCRDQFRTNPNIRIVDFSGNTVLPPLMARTYCSGFKYCYGYGSGPISVMLALLNVYGENCY